MRNNVAWSPDRKTFYCGCSAGNVIYAYDYDAAEGSVANRRPLAVLLEMGDLIHRAALT
jgi:sugar lactone lactonase YvrE